MTILLAISVAVLVYLWLVAKEDIRLAWYQIRSLEKQLSAASELRHDIANSAMKGCPAVKWFRQGPIPPGADAWYWLFRSEGDKLLYSDEATRTARERGKLLLGP